MWGPQGSDRGERRWRGREAETEGESTFARRHRGTHGPGRPAREAAAQEEEWVGAVAWADWARIIGEFKIRFDFEFKWIF
jgi:hypothetical protein